MLAYETLSNQCTDRLSVWNEKKKKLIEILNTKNEKFKCKNVSNVRCKRLANFQGHMEMDQN